MLRGRGVGEGYDFLQNNFFVVKDFFVQDSDDTYAQLFQKLRPVLVIFLLLV
jgi:hypothetical protein